MLTPEQREEGRRLLTVARRNRKARVSATDDTTGEWLQWIHKHADALLADTEIDVAEIKRQSVREFVALVVRTLEPRRKCAKDAGEAELARGLSQAIFTMCNLSVDRGVNLDEKR